MNKLLIALFVAVIALPLAATVAGRDGADPQAENRELAAFPRVDGSWESLRRFPAGLAAWFEDHFAFRSTLVRWSAESRLFGLDTAPTPTVIKGRNGWFFYGEDGSIEDYTSSNPLSADELANWRAALSRARDSLQAQGIRYVFTIAPDKYAIYPEQMPESLIRIAAQSRTDQLFDALTGSGVSAVDVRPALLRAKAHERVYQQTDTHWNDRGVFAAYQDIIAAVRAQVRAVPPAWTRDDFEPETREIEGMDLAGMMGLKRVLRETDLVLVPKHPRQAHVVDPPGADETAEEGRLITEIPGSNLPRAVVFRDSFASRLVPFLSEHFSRAVYLWQNDFDPEVVEREHPDVVIQEIVGRHLYSFIPSPELVPEQ
jgi:alginate O-acetyltransferase complex protein AlgJ